MANYRLFSSTSGPATPASYTQGNPFIAGVVFTVTSNCWISGIYMWCCSSGQSTTAPKVALWSTNTTLSGESTTQAVIASATGSSAMTPGAWNLVSFATPVQVSIGDTLIAAVGVNGPFPDTSNGWGTSYPDGITDGPLFAYGIGTTQGGTSYYNGGYGNPDGYQQGVFSVGGSDPATTMPASVSGTDNFWVDVLATDVDPLTSGETYRLWPNKAGADTMTQTDDSTPYTTATEIHVTSASVLQKIWYYSPPGATLLATSADVWTVGSGTSGTSLVSNSSPSWLLPDGSAASAGDGWVYADMPTTALPVGKYKASIYNANGTNGTKRLSYWGTESGDSAQTAWGEATGITNGPLYAPPTALASTCLSYGNESQTEPGQSSFSVGPGVSYPNLYVGANSPGGDLYQNYWIDMEVILSTGGSSPSTNALLSMFP